MANKSKHKAKGTSPAYDKQKMFVFYRASVADILRDWDTLSGVFLNHARAAYLKKHFPVLEDRMSLLFTTSVYMGVAQLFDPLTTFNDHTKSNLVLRRVIDDLAPPVGSSQRKQIDADYVAMQPTVQLIKEWRNVVGAHRSLATVMKIVDYIMSGHTHPHPLPRIPIGKLRDVVKRLISITDTINTHVEGQWSQWYEPALAHEIDTIFELIAEQHLPKK
jgi:hypothetical protein